MTGLFYKFLKFGVVGFTGVFVDFGITYLLKEKLKVYKYMANATGFIIAATSNYFLNRVWTFHSKNPQIFFEYSHFIMVSIIGLGINSLVLWLLVSRYKKHFYLSKLLAIGVTTIWNFAANIVFTFH
jgi:putative flippase GtrA